MDGSVTKLNENSV